ncbi:ATP-grasp domain-containing protein [Streptomyces sp. SP17KL33]|uniref:ATP-grasp domain-containing protein n=1 Tax=Streptomyces sp. SP17KL33 TaxID=3002534 RepID=UPI002E77ED79|nr:ATP-grasp domain-containing protein [Streptomyces sp. SP17KL33]MEE1831710.1 ATP-grasp domain-containing protein [Streptomyces sp. SP17KL33]
MSAESYLLIIGSGPREYREELFRSLSGRRLWLFTDRTPTWQLDYIAGHTVIPQLNAARVSAKVAFLSEAASRLTASAAVEGVLTFEEMFLSAASQLADELGLPSLSYGAAENCRDKQRTRELLTAAGIRQPSFRFARSAEEASAIGAEFGYPVVVKPRGLAGSMGVNLVHSAADIEEGFRIATSAARIGAQRHGGGALIEQYLEGPEIAVDSVVVDGRLEPLYIVRKRFGPKPFFEESGQTVNADDPLLLDAELMAMIQAAFTALGLRNAMTHTEVKLTAAGPVIVEVNGRLAGDFVPHVAKLATGLDGAILAAQVACGEPVDTARRVRRSAAHQIAYADRGGRFNYISLPDAGSHPYLVASGTLLAPGATVTLPPDGYMARCGYVIVAAPSADECDASLAAAVRDMSVDITPSRDATL